MSERYHPNSDQVAFADSVGKSLVSMLPLARLHQLNTESDATWAALRELGVFGIATPEDEGGSGLGATEEALIVVWLGRRVVSASVLASLGAAHLRAAAGSALGDRRVCAGYRRDGRNIIVEGAPAELVLMRNDTEVALHALPTPSADALPLLDAQLWASQLLESSALGPRLARATAAQASRLRLIDAAALAGIARAALDMAVSYAGMREQFGRPIGSFQAIKHHCANMALRARCAADQVSFAAVALDDGRGDALLQVESALYVAGAAAVDNCGLNIQVHGGMGFSDETEPHLLLKRARVLVEIAGGLEAALDRIGAITPSTHHEAAQRATARR